MATTATTTATATVTATATATATTTATTTATVTATAHLASIEATGKNFKFKLSGARPSRTQCMARAPLS